MKSLYEILGVSPTATDAQIKGAYKKKALKLHPDKNPTDRVEAEKKFKELAAAYEVLIHRQTRERYDNGSNDRDKMISAKNTILLVERTINNLVVNFSNQTTAEKIEQHKALLMTQLKEIISSQELADACKVFNLTLHPFVRKALAAKEREIDLRAEARTKKLASVTRSLTQMAKEAISTLTSPTMPVDSTRYTNNQGSSVLPTDTTKKIVTPLEGSELKKPDQHGVNAITKEQYNGGVFEQVTEASSLDNTSKNEFVAAFPFVASAITATEPQIGLSETPCPSDSSPDKTPVYSTNFNHFFLNQTPRLLISAGPADNEEEIKQEEDGSPRYLQRK